MGLRWSASKQPLYMHRLFRCGREEIILHGHRVSSFLTHQYSYLFHVVGNNALNQKVMQDGSLFSGRTKYS